jgi:hypothetical protein
MISASAPEHFTFGKGPSKFNEMKNVETAEYAAALRHNTGFSTE